MRAPIARRRPAGALPRRRPAARGFAVRRAARAHRLSFHFLPLPVPTPARGGAGAFARRDVEWRAVELLLLHAFRRHGVPHLPGDTETYNKETV